MELSRLVGYLQQILQPERFSDYCPNGLQIQGRSNVLKIVSGVTASMDLLQAAADVEADAVLVHHGFFWKNEDPCIVGIKQKRIKFLLDHNISLLAYHLPLDAHPELGNNAQLANRLGLNLEGCTGNQNILAYGTLSELRMLGEFSEFVDLQLDRTPMVIGSDSKQIKRVAWCSGGAQSYMQDAIDLGVDLFISGEISEQTYHLARESGVAYMAAGHHATERYGVKALADHVAARFSISQEFIDIHKPV